MASNSRFCLSAICCRLVCCGCFWLRLRLRAENATWPNTPCAMRRESTIASSDLDCIAVISRNRRHYLGRRGNASFPYSLRKSGCGTADSWIHATRIVRVPSREVPAGGTSETDLLAKEQRRDEWVQSRMASFPFEARVHALSVFSFMDSSPPRGEARPSVMKISVREALRCSAGHETTSPSRSLGFLSEECIREDEDDLSELVENVLHNVGDVHFWCPVTVLDGLENKHFLIS